MSRAPQIQLRDVFDRVDRAVAVDDLKTYPMLGVRSFGVGCFDAGRKKGSETRYKHLLEVRADDLIYPRLMAWEGAFGLVPAELDRHYVSPEFCTFAVRSGRADPAYIGHLFRWPPIWKSVAGSSSGTNVRRRRLYPDHFLAQSIPLPSIEAQRSIASELNAVHAASARIVAKAEDQLKEIAALIEAALRDVPCAAVLGEVLDLDLDVVNVEPQREYSFAGVYSFGRGLFSRGNLRGIEMSYRRLHRLHAGRLF